MESDDISGKPARRRRTGRIFFISAAVLLLSLLLGELFARFYLGLGDPPLSIADPQIEYLFKPGTYHRFGRVIHFNDFSMRSPDITLHKTDPQQCRVLIVGDSVINGGAETDDSQTMTSLLQGDLAKKLNRPIFVGNISAGSWGPPNEMAYLKRFGTFDADAIVLEVSGHDGADAPTFEPVVGVVPGMPGRKPVSALWEGFTRYLLPRLHTQPPSDPSVPDGSAPLSDMKKRRDECRDAIIQMADLCKSQNIPFEIELFWGRDELLMGADPNQYVILDAAKASGVKVINLEKPLRDAMKNAPSPIYRDGIHPNAAGNRVAMVAIEPSILEMLQSSPKH